MDWWAFILVFFALLMTFMFLGIPIAFSFLATNFILVAFIMGFENGMNQLVLGTFNALTNFSLTPIILFVFMGEILFRSGVVIRTLDVISMWTGRIPGRLSVISVSGGTVFAALSGSSLANTSMLGTTLVPDMHRRGYHMSMCAGPILGAGSLAMLIPPSNMIVLLGSIGKISIADLLIGGITPGLVMALFFIIYIVVSCTLKPSLAPAYEVEQVSWNERIQSLFKFVLPLGIIFALVIGLVFLGVATPTESAAFGVFGSLVLTAAYRTLTKEVIKKATIGTLKVSGMLYLIIAGSSGFSQLLSFTGASRQMIQSVLGFELSDVTVIIIMLLIVLVLGMFLEQVSIIMITLPLFMPIILEMGVNPVWFGLMFLVCLDLGNLTPPVGMALYTILGSIRTSISNVTMNDIIKSAVPIILIELFVLALMFAFPDIFLYLVNASRGS